MNQPTNSPSVSVVIATHNRREWLSRAIQSVLAQQFASFEIIVVNDASSDDTATWLATQTAPQLRHITLAQPSERNVARNTGLTHANGRWIMFLDDDDRLRPTALKALLAAAESKPDLGSAVGNRCHDYGDQDPRNYDETHPRFACTKTIWPELVFGWSAVSGQNLYRTTLIRKIGGYSGEIPCEDRALWLKIAHSAPTAIIPDVTLDYRQHPGQVRPANIEEIRERVYAEFAATLSLSEQKKCARLRRACHAWKQAEAAFQRRQRHTATQALISALLSAPSLLTSPLTGPHCRAWAKRIARRTLTGW